MKKFLTVQVAAAAALLLLGACVMTGWIVHDARLIRLHPRLPGVVFNAALGFVLLGLAFGLPAFGARRAGAAQAALGALLLALGGAVLLEYGGLELALDATAWQSWLGDGNLRPGRMAPGVALSLALCGAALIALPRVRSRRAGLAIQGATLLVFLSGFAGLSSYFLRLDLLYAWYPSVRAAPQAAAAQLLAGVALWSNWRQAEWYRGRRFFQDDEKTGYVGATILAVIAASAGVIGFSVQQAALEKSFTRSLQTQLKSQTMLFQSAVRHAAAAADSAARRPELALLLRQLDGAAPDPRALGQLRLAGESVLAAGINGVAVYDRGGRALLRLGRFGQRAGTEAALGLPQAGTLFWDNGPLLHSRVALAERGAPLGAVEIEQDLPDVLAQFMGPDGAGVSSRMGMCARRAERLLCYPHRQQTTLQWVPRLGPQGDPVPMSLAVDGQSGVFSGLDNRGRQVLAAYGPLAPSGLGLIVKQDAAELYEPIREQLQAYALLLLVLVAGGAMLLRSQVTPMVSRLLESERAAGEREAHIQAVLDNVGEGIVTFDERGSIESFNRAAVRIFGYGAAEACGRSVFELLAPAARGHYEAALRGFAATGAQDAIGARATELPAVRKDGGVFPAEVTISQVRIGARRLFVGIARDITRQKRAERALQESEARSREITATLGEGIFVVDRAGLILSSNPAARQLLGWPEQELLGRCGHALLHHTRADGRPYPMGECDISAVLETGRSFRSHDDVFWRKDGGMLPISVNATPIVRAGQVVGAVVAFHDIIERKKAERALQAESAKNAMLLRTASDGIHVLDPQGDVVQVNDAFCRMLGYTPRQMLGMNVAQWDAQWNAAELRDKMASLLARDALFETRHRRRDGSVFDVEIHAGGVVINGAQLLYASARDISERKKAARQVHHLAHFDILTDLPNRALLNERLALALASAPRHAPAHLALMFVDLDRFKPVNDTFGHHVGDLLLQEVARRVQACLRESDTVARVGGDEFVVLLPQIEGEAAALLVAGKILRALGQPCQLDGHPLRIGASIGVATYPQHGADQEQLLKSADRAMYHAKQGGGGAIFSFGQLETAA